MRKSIIACAVVALVVGGGSATAASLITSAQIKDGTIKNRDVARNTISLNRLSPGLQRQLRRASSQSNTAASTTAPAAGPAGAKGDKGDRGDTGAAGRNGTNGTNGTNGQNGAPGAPGQNGLNADGSRTERIRAIGEGGFADQSVGDSDLVFENGGLTLLADTTSANALARLVKTFPTPRRVADLQTLAYAYSIADREGTVAPLIRLRVVDADSPTDASKVSTELIFEPTYTDSAANGGTINARTGQWWSTQPIEGATGRDSYVDGIQPLNDMIAENPDMKITSFTIEAGMESTGSPWRDFEGAVDFLTIGFADDDEPIRYNFG